MHMWVKHFSLQVEIDDLWLIYPLSAAAGLGASRRPGWDLKGKVSDMESKVNNYQSKIKSVNLENDHLKNSITKAQKHKAEIEDENRGLKKHLR